MPQRRADVLMITYRTPEYVRLSLPRLLDTTGPNDRVWLWHNGDHAETLNVVKEYIDHPRIHMFRHSHENVRVHEPTRWLWENSDAGYVGRVDDDCLAPTGWIDELDEAFSANPEFAAIATWPFRREDFDPELSETKLAEYAGGHRLLRNLWVQGSGHLVATRWIDSCGQLRPGETFTQYCRRLSRSGGINGWLFPFVLLDHMDDPRSPHTLLRSDADLATRVPLSAEYHAVRTIADWTAQLRNSARMLQAAPLDIAHYEGVRAKLRNGSRRLQRKLGRRTTW